MPAAWGGRETTGRVRQGAVGEQRKRFPQKLPQQKRGRGGVAFPIGNPSRGRRGG